MSLDALFRHAGTLAMLGWLALALAPLHRHAAGVIATVVIPALLAIAYAALVLTGWSRASGGFGSLDAVAALFGARDLLLAGWIHFLAFDLFVGAWIVREAHRAGMPHVAILPALALTFLFGPAGYLLFLAQRGARGAAALARGRALLASWEPTPLAAGVLLLLAMLPTIAASILDDRMLRGEPVWWKPLRFQAAIAVFLLTLSWLYSLAGPGFRRTILGRAVVWAAIVPGLLEAIYISFQAAHGLHSHWNVGAPLYAWLYTAMGVGAVTLAFTAVLLAWGIARAPLPVGAPRWTTFRLAAVIGLVLTFVLGAVEGGYMSSQTGHAVGAAIEGAATLPVTGWSRSQGDLRVAHFLGLHAQQVIPVFGLVAAALLTAWARTAVVTFSVLYAGVTLATFVQALGGRPFLPG